MSITFLPKSGPEGNLFKIKDLILLNGTGSEIECEECAKGLCYVDQGILIQLSENTDQSPSEYIPTDEYIWTDYCGYGINNY